MASRGGGTRAPLRAAGPTSANAQVGAKRHVPTAGTGAPGSRLGERPRTKTRAENEKTSSSGATAASAPKKSAEPTPLETLTGRLPTLSREWITAELAMLQGVMDSLEAQCEAAVNLGDRRVEEHKASLERKARQLEAAVREERANHDDLREATETVKQKEQALLEEAKAIDADTQRLEAVDLPQARQTIDKLDQTLELKRAAVEKRKQELDALRVQRARAQDITYGLSNEAANIVRETEANKQRRAKVKEDTMRHEIERRALFNEYEELKGTIRVYARVKGGSKTHDPGAAKYSYPVSEEIERQNLVVTQSRSNATSTGTRESSATYSYDRVFGPTMSQQDVFAEVGTLVDSAVDGFKACAFAYGQTGSGKTYTMEGSRTDPGIIPRSINRVFERIEALRQDQWEYTVSCSFVEIYNDCLRNLLETSESYHREFVDGHQLAVRLKNKHDIVHVGKSDTTVSGVKDIVVKSPADIRRLLDVANKNRSVAKTNMNERSSRSHCVFTMRINGSNRALQQSSRGILCLIDLAGSERVNESGVSGKELKEAIAINRSLMHLGDCIATLGSSNSVVSWRNCRLTYLLQNFLGGDGAKMLMLVTVSDREEHLPETNNSLRFASKVNVTRVATAKKRTAQTE